MGKGIHERKKRIFSTIIISVIVILTLISILMVFTGTPPGYTSVTLVCISCHNDSGFPNDTDNNSIIAPYKRPHNDSVMCETCHRSNPHTIGFIQQNGLFGLRSTAVSCPECHQTGVPNFTSAPMIPPRFMHGNNITQGSKWGSYWNSSQLKTACIYCHDNTLHNITPVGRILGFALRNSSSCSNCHYKGNANYSIMINSFSSAGLERPPEITNGTGWNGSESGYYNHTLDQYSNDRCKMCHGSYISLNATMPEFVHNVSEAAGGECIGCHTSNQNMTGSLFFEGINLSSFGKHINVNTSNGINQLTNDDCTTCHYDFNFSEMMLPNFTTRTKTCTECHIDGNFSAPVISNHRPNGTGVATTTYCSTCHNNSINRYAYSVNASVGHYGTNASLVKPTVNQTARPVNGFMDSTDASSYNRECNNCHNPKNTSYGNPPLITMPHTPTATCNQCHVNTNATDLHNASIIIPGGGCVDCHSVNASRYKAPNLTGTDMIYSSFCDSNTCHGTYPDNGNNVIDSLGEHNINRNERGFTGRGGYTDTVYLNGQTSLTVPKGAIVTITSRVNDSSGSASRVGGAEYYYSSTDPGQSKGISMNAVDGQFDAVNGNWENVIATLDTSGLPVGTYTINVRGVDIGKQWSQVKNATLIVQSLGYINGTVTSGGSGVAGASISATNASTTSAVDGSFNLSISSGTYNVTASKQPEYYDNITSGVTVTQGNTTTLYIVIIGKPTGTLSGVVRSI